MKKPEHPVWRLLRISIILLFMYFVMKDNATNFDDGERATLKALGTALAGNECFGMWRDRS